jgi:hypothetical protein
MPSRSQTTRQNYKSHHAPHLTSQLNTNPKSPPPNRHHSIYTTFNIHCHSYKWSVHPRQPYMAFNFSHIVLPALSFTNRLFSPTVRSARHDHSQLSAWRCLH